MRRGSAAPDPEDPEVRLLRCWALSQAAGRWGVRGENKNPKHNKVKKLNLKIT